MRNMIVFTIALTLIVRCVGKRLRSWWVKREQEPGLRERLTAQITAGMTSLDGNPG
ncbi:MAG TPA: hypothetical protein VN452_08185 [Longilinea sp.]|nr:hypothetical protein [Longilinea sp.]